MLSRIKYINRWGLMRNTRQENLSEHTLEVAYITHALAAIKNRLYGGTLDVGAAVLTALYHDCSEIITGDLPTPVKYANPALKDAYKGLEREAARQLGDMLPPMLREEYLPYLQGSGGDSELRGLVKAADKISALIKCIEEEASGNTEFSGALKSVEKTVCSFPQPEVRYFLEHFLSAYSLSLDDLKADIPSSELREH